MASARSSTCSEPRNSLKMSRSLARNTQSLSREVTRTSTNGISSWQRRAVTEDSLKECPRGTLSRNSGRAWSLFDVKQSAQNRHSAYKDFALQCRTLHGRARHPEQLISHRWILKVLSHGQVHEKRTSKNRTLNKIYFLDRRDSAIYLNSTSTVGCYTCSLIYVIPYRITELSSPWWYWRICIRSHQAVP